jgi:acyl-[acyl carrier protein]--UDP-N-acetylglucosamine O-acyltransferase
MNGPVWKELPLFPGAVIAYSQDLNLRVNLPRAELAIIPLCAILHSTRVQLPAEKTDLGSNCLLQSYAHLAHVCHLKDHVILESFAGLAGRVRKPTIGNISPIPPCTNLPKLVNILSLQEEVW